MNTELIAYVSPYISELLSVGLIAIFMAVSPGADFVMVTRNSLLYSRLAGVYSALGISLAIWIHVAYSIAGLSIIIAKSIILFSIVKYCGAAYLLYIGWRMLRSSPNVIHNTGLDTPSLSALSAFKMGFITNALNPKTTLFFISLFTQFVDAQTPLWLQIVYGAMISLAHGIWFCLVATFLSQPSLLKAFNRYKHRAEQAIGGLLIVFGLKVATASHV